MFVSAASDHPVLMRVHTVNKRGLAEATSPGYDFASSVKCSVTITRTNDVEGSLVIEPVENSRDWEPGDDGEKTRDLVASTDGVTLFKQVRK